jgi:soluble lytic murein transglycosylase-like protein
VLTVDSSLLGLVDHFAVKYGVNRNTILALIMQESGYNPYAIGDAGQSFGFMQLYLAGAGGGHEDWELLAAPRNLDIGCAYYSRCVEATATRQEAISAYNQGIGGLQANGLEVNRAYWESVSAMRDRLDAEGVGESPTTPLAVWS